MLRAIRLAWRRWWHRHCLLWQRPPRGRALLAHEYRLFEYGDLLGWTFEVEIEGVPIQVVDPAGRWTPQEVHDDAPLAERLMRGLVGSRHGTRAAQRARFTKVFAGLR